MNNQAKEGNLLEQYNRRLEDENKAKTEEIRVLREQLDKQGTTRIISTSSTVSNVANCSNCKTKEAEISNLGKTLKQIQDRYDAEIRKLSGTKSETKVLYKQVESKAQTAEIERLKRAYDELKAKYDEGQKVEWSTIKVDGSEANRPQAQTLALKEENAVLLSRVEFLQKRLISVEDANRVLREEMLSSMNARNIQPAPVIYSQPVQQQVQQPIKTSVIYSTPVTTSIPVQLPIPVSAPVYRYVSPQKAVSFNLPSPAPESYSIQYSSCCNHLSPLAVLGHSHQHGHHHGYQRGHSPSHNSFVHDYSYETDYGKDIVEQRWRSLQHKIRKLEEENGKLRTQIVLPMQYY